MELFSKDEKLDFITINESSYIHKQVERRNGILYMRMKKRMIRNEA